MGNNPFELQGASSVSVNGQLVPSVRGGNYYPRPLSATGPGGQGLPAYPPQSSAPSLTASSGGGAAVASATSNPWSPVSSPVPWLIGFLIVGFLLLRFVHHGY